MEPHTIIFLIFVALFVLVYIISAPDHFSTIPVYVINLRDRPNKKAKMMRELEYNNVKATFVEAIDGRKLNLPEMKYNEIIKDALDYRKLRKGEIGCYLSHIKCWDLMEKNNQKYALILEDDVIFSDNFRDDFNRFFDYISKNSIDWDIISLGRRCKTGWFDKPCLEGKRIYGNAFIPETMGYGAFAYIIKLDTTRKLLKTTFPISKPIDVIIPDEFDKKNIKVIAFTEDLITVIDIINSDTMGFK